MKKLLLCILLNMSFLFVSAQTDSLTLLLNSDTVSVKIRDSVIGKVSGSPYDLSDIKLRAFSFVNRIELGDDVKYYVKNNSGKSVLGQWEFELKVGDTTLKNVIKMYYDSKEDHWVPFQLAGNEVKIHLKKKKTNAMDTIDYMLNTSSFFANTLRFESMEEGDSALVLKTSYDTIKLEEGKPIELKSIFLKKNKLGDIADLTVGGIKVNCHEYGKDYVYVELPEAITLTSDSAFSIKCGDAMIYQIVKSEEISPEPNDNGFIKKNLWWIIAGLVLIIAAVVLLISKPWKKNQKTKNNPSTSGSSGNKNTKEEQPQKSAEQTNKNDENKGPEKEQSVGQVTDENVATEQDAKKDQHEETIESLKQQIEKLTQENVGLKSDMNKLKPNHQFGKNVVVTSIGTKIRKQWPNISPSEAVMDEWVDKGQMKKLLFAILKEEFKSKTELKKLLDKDKEIEEFKTQLDAALQQYNVSSTSTFDLTREYYKLSREGQNKVHEFIWEKYTKACGSVPEPPVNGKDLESIMKYWCEVMKRANKDPKDEMVIAAQNGRLPQEVKEVVAAEIVGKVNEKITEEGLHFASESCGYDSLIEMISEKINHKLDGTDIELLAQQRAAVEIAKLKADLDVEKETMEKDCKNAIDEAQKGKQKAEEHLKEVEIERDETKKQLNDANTTIETNKEKYEENKRKQDEKYKKEIENLNADHEKEMKEEKDKAAKDKESCVNAEVSKTKAVQARLDAKTNEYAEELVKRKACMKAYVSMVKSTLAQVQSSVKTAYQGNDMDSPLASLVSKSIMDNMVYSFSDFENDINNVLDKAEEKELSAFKEQLQKTYWDCLAQDMPTWLDVLSRLYAYSNVGFIAGQFVQKGINLTHVGEAFLATKSLLSQLEIEIVMPTLFKDIYDPDRYELQSVKNIEGYVDDIATHVDNANAIVDLYTVGFKVNGEIKEKPVVSKF